MAVGQRITICAAVLCLVGLSDIACCEDWKPLTMDSAKRLLVACDAIADKRVPLYVDYLSSVKEKVVTPEGVVKVLSYEVQAKIANRGEKTYRGYLSPTVDDGALIPADGWNKYVFDGVKTVRNANQESNGGVPVYSVSSNAKEALVTVKGPVKGLRLTYVTDFLNPIVEGSLPEKATAECRTETFQGETVQALRLKIENREVDAIFRSEGIQVPIRIRYLEDGQELFSSQVFEYTQDGIPYPKKIAVSQGDPSNPDLVTNIQVTEFHQDASQIPDTLFELEVPEDAFVYDMDIGRTLRNPTVIEEHLNRLSGISVAGKSFSAIVLLNLGLLALIAARFFRKRLAR